MANEKIKWEIPLWERVRRMVQYGLRRVSTGLNRLSAAWPNPFTRWVASHGTPRRLKRGIQALACAILCLWVFSIAMPLFAVTPPVVVRQETPELVNTVSFDADTALYSLELNWVRGPIIVRAYDGESIVVNEYAKQGLKTDEKGRITLFRGNLAVDWNNDLIALDSGVAGGLYKRVEVLIPRKLAGAMEYVRILSGASDILVQDLRLSISARAEVTSGSVQVRGVVAPEFVTGSESGKVTVSACTFDDVRAKTQSGTLQFLDCVTRSADVRSVNGAVHYSGVLEEGSLLSYSGVLSTRLSMQPQDLSLVSTSGNITVELPENGGYTVTSQTERLSSTLSEPLHTENGVTLCGTGSGNVTVDTWQGRVFLKPLQG